jgi:tetratricopeptide (TPR) repeat protein
VGGLNLIYTVRGEHLAALQFAERAVELASRTMERDLIGFTHGCLGWSRLWMGDFERALPQFEAELEFYDSARHKLYAAIYGIDLRVMALRWMSYALWALGYPGRALQIAKEALEWAESLSHPHSIVAMTDHFCWLYADLGDWPAARGAAERQAGLCEEEGLPFFASTARHYLGLALIHLGEPARGIELIRQHQAEFDTFGSRSSRPRSLASLALGLMQLKRYDEAVLCLDAALERCESQSERLCQSEILRLQGEVHLLTGGPDERAEEAFTRAIEVARGQKAKSFELKCASSLARLLLRQGRRLEAQNILVPVYEWFTEGCNTPDLEQARALRVEIQQPD